MFDSPARFFSDFPLFRRNRFQCLLVKIENHAISAITDCVRFDLYPAAQRFLEHRLELVWFLREIAGRFGRVAVRFQQRGSTRTQRPVKNNFDCTLCESVIEFIDCRSFFQKSLRIFARSVNRIDESNFRCAINVGVPDKIDIVLVAAGILDFAPAQTDLAIDPAQ